MNAEDELAWQLAAFGAVERQYLYAPGRRLRADFAYPGHRLLVEVQGGVYTKRAHGSVGGVLRDIDRLNAATLAGWRLIRVMPEWCDHRDGRALRLIERALRGETR